MNRRPRILLVSGNPPEMTCGIAHYTQRLLAELQLRRPDWTWSWLHRRPRWNDRPFFRRENVSYLRPLHRWAGVEAPLGSLAVRLSAPDILHIQEELYSFHETRIQAQLARAATGSVVATLHEYHTDRPSSAHTSALVALSDVVAANDNRTADRCLTFEKRAVDHVWWSPSNVPALRQPVAKQPGLVVTFGLISAAKGLDAAHAALREVRRRHPALRWRIVGPFHPESNPGHAALRQKLSEDWINFTGNIPDIDSATLQHALAEAEVMFLPYSDGASPRRTTLHAAWTLGLPVVTTAPPVEEPSLRDGVNCRLVDASNSAGWVEVLDNLLADPALRSKLHQGSLAQAEAFSWAKLAGEHLQMYEGLLR